MRHNDKRKLMMSRPSSINTRKTMLALAIGCALSGGNLYAQEQESMATDGELANIEEIVVRGVRASQAQAIDIKRNSRTVVDSIVAEDIGKLPDVTITDSLQDRKSTRLNSSHVKISYAVFCLKKKIMSRDRVAV